MSHPRLNKPLILIVDDDQLILDLAEEILMEFGYPVLTADSGVSALSIAAGHPREIGLAIIDVVMPDMDGVETAQRLHDLDNSIPILLSSGFTASEDFKTLDREGVVGLIPKPYGIQSLMEAAAKFARKHAGLTQKTS